MANKELYRGSAIFQVTTVDGTVSREMVSYEQYFETADAAEKYLESEMSRKISGYSEHGHHWKIISMVVEKIDFESDKTEF